MIRALRRARLAQLAAAVALFATMPITVSSLLHDGTDDTICNPAVVVHDAEAHHVDAATAAVPHSQHFVLFHALQSLRAGSLAVRFSPPPLGARLLGPPAAPPVHAPPHSPPPPPAPPAAAP